MWPMYLDTMEKVAAYHF